MEKLIGLDPAEFQHDLDKKALDKFKNAVAFRKLMIWYIHQGVERMYRIQYTGSCLKVDPKAYPDLHRCIADAGEVLGFEKDKLPQFYLQFEPIINAFTIGEKEPLVVAYSGTMDLLGPAELQYVIGHELGHILCHHVLYHMIINSMVNAFDLGIVTKAIELPMYYWIRCSELSADRAGLLATQDINASIRAMIKMAGLPPSHYNRINEQAFIDQARDFNEKNTGTLDETFKFLAIAYSSHPWLVLRAAELLKWYEGGEYSRILERHKAFNCPHCGNEIAKEPNICPICGGKH